MFSILKKKLNEENNTQTSGKKKCLQSLGSTRFGLQDSKQVKEGVHPV